VMPKAVNIAHNLPNGLFMFRPDMTPLVNTPGFKRGIEKYLALANLSNPVLDRQGVIDQIVRGEALMAIDWGDTGPASLSAGSAAKFKLGYALAPGTRTYFDWVTNAWVDTRDVHYAPLHQANGFAFYMTSTSDHKDLVWRFIKYMNSPAVSMGIVSDQRGGYQPWRTSHNEVSKWKDAGWLQEDATNYVDTILRSVNHENASLDIRIPGASEYGTTLENHLVRLLAAASPNIDAEMDACAMELQAVTDAHQREAQVQRYRAHLGLEKN
jgi:multiple sugar transport system substrate-binding protein